MGPSSCLLPGGGDFRPAWTTRPKQFGSRMDVEDYPNLYSSSDSRFQYTQRRQFCHCLTRPAATLSQREKTPECFTIGRPPIPQRWSHGLLANGTAQGTAQGEFLRICSKIARSIQSKDHDPQLHSNYGPCQ